MKNNKFGRLWQVILLVVLFACSIAGTYVWHSQRDKAGANGTSRDTLADADKTKQQGADTSTPSATPAVDIAGRNAGATTPVAVEPNKVPKQDAAAAKPAAGLIVTHKLGNTRGETDVVIALDELAVRLSNNHFRVEKFDPVDSLAALEEKAKTLDAPFGVRPVAYRQGVERNEYNRQYVTEGILVKSTERDRVVPQANGAGLKLRGKASFSDKWVAFDAVDAFAALEALPIIAKADKVVNAQVMLASKIEKMALPNDPKVTEQWQFKYTPGIPNVVQGTDINVESVWNYPNAGIRGKDVTIAIVDDSVETAHEDLAANIIPNSGWDFRDGDNNPNPVWEDDNHGTSVAGDSAAIGNNNRGVTGSAPEARIIPVRLIGPEIDEFDIANALTWQLDNFDVSNNSWGPNNRPIEEIVEDALIEGITNGRGGLGSIYLFAAGNSGDESDNTNYNGYSNSIYNITVGAVDSMGRHSYYSEPGACLVVSAPSNGDIPALGKTTTDRMGAVGYDTSNYTDSFGGTSSATPTTSGVVALMLEKNPNLGWRDVQEILISSARKFAPQDGTWVDNGAGFHFSHLYGAGIVDATAAVALAGNWVNLPTWEHSEVVLTNLNQDIVNGSPVGIVNEFDFSASNLRVEHATLTVDINHTGPEDLEIDLISPSGMISRMAEVHTVGTPSYRGFTFSSVRHWGESSTGKWKVKVADKGASGTGTIIGLTVTLHGSGRNPSPEVVITAPVDGDQFSPNVPVTIQATANDMAARGQPGQVVSVKFYDGATLLFTDTAEPWEYIYPAPILGSHTLTAVAEDEEGLKTTSAPVTFIVLNKKPVITAGSLIPADQCYEDVALVIDGLAYNDPEAKPVTITYDWQYCIDGKNWISLSPANNTATLPASVDNVQKLWRCVITPRDDIQDGDALVTNATNVLFLPPGPVNPGSGYSYDSGLVLRPYELPITKDVIINEFSQGSSTVQSAGDWVELLVMRTSSLKNFKLADSLGGGFSFKNTAVWDNIPAGTLIVVYNGNTGQKDALLPADDLSPVGDGKMVIGSKNQTYFTNSPNSWLTLGATGGGIAIKNAANEVVHSIAYGAYAGFTPNVGNVPNGRSAFHETGTEAGASTTEGWRIVTSTAKRDFATLALTPRLSLASRSYSQDFNTLPGATGTEYPPGWSGFTNVEGNVLDHATMALDLTGTSPTPRNYNYGSYVGLRGAQNAFDPSSIVLAIANTRYMKDIVVSYDIVQASQGALSTNFSLQYSITSPTSGFKAVPGGEFTLAANAGARGTVVNKSNIALPAEFADQDLPVYLRWYYKSATPSVIATRPALGIDNFSIHAGTTDNVLLLNFDPSTFAENAGVMVDAGKVSISTVQATDTVVNLASQSPGRLTVPATVTIPAGETFKYFDLTLIDNNYWEYEQTVTITATADPLIAAANTVTITDDDPSLDGVTPGQPNNVPNGEMVHRLWTNDIFTPATFRIAAGSTLPEGLSIDPETGVISGIIAASVLVGNYPVVIERINDYGEVVSQTIVIEVIGAPIGYADWVDDFVFPPGADTTPTGDPNHDGVPNAISMVLGGNPATGSDLALLPTIELISNPGEGVPAGDYIVFTYRRTDLAVAAGLDIAMEYDADLVAAWKTAVEGVDSVKILVDNDFLFVPAPVAPATTADRVRVFIPRNGNPELFGRLRAMVPAL